MLSVIGIEIETGQHLSITNCFDLQGRSPPSPGRATTDAAADNDGAVLRVAERRKKSAAVGMRKPNASCATCFEFGFARWLKGAGLAG